MPNYHTRRCVFGCSTIDVSVHDFPNPDKFPQQFKRWVEIVGQSLMNLTPEAIYRKKKVCCIHFTEKDWNRNKRLNALAVPSLHIPASQRTLYNDHDYCKINESTNETSMETTPINAANAENADVPSKMPFKDLTNIPCTSTSQLETATTSLLQAVHEDHKYCNLDESSNTCDALTAAITEPHKILLKDVTNLPSTSRSTLEAATTSLLQAVHEDHKYCNLDESSNTCDALTAAITEPHKILLKDVTNLPSTSRSTLEAATTSLLQAVHEDHKYCNLDESSNTCDALTAAITEPHKIPLKDVTNLPSTSRSTLEAGNLESKNQTTHQLNPMKRKSLVPSAPASVAKRARKTLSKGLKQMPDFRIRVYKNTQRSIRNLRREIIRLRKRSKLFKNRLQDAEQLSDNVSFRNVTRKMTLAAKLFTEMQFYQTEKKAKGRRFKLEHKILSLSLYKRSPKAYSLLSKCFTLPSPKTLKKLLSKIKLESGLNKLIFKKIKQAASLMNTEDKLCTLIFDEMHITPQVKYDTTKDEIKGFTTHGTNEIADHALVFMVKGIKKSFKQPVAYYFTNCLKKEELKSILQDVVKHVSATGLNIICTICDQSSVNVSTINSLIEDTKREFFQQGKAWKTDLFRIGKKQIIPLYDVPHLLKGIRNNLLTKDIKITCEDNVEKIIKWRYFQDLYEADKACGELRFLHKITEEHVDPNKINKMKVKHAVQIFSHSVAVAAQHMTQRGDLSQECKSIIPFVLLIDKLFDSLNVNTFHSQGGKIYKGAVKPHSPHHKLWQEALTFFRGLKYLSPKKEGTKIRLVETMVPTIKNFVKTIEGFQELWKILHHKYGFDSMLTRNFNQDPIENFFGNIRSLGARNVSPDCVGFEGAYKSLLLNNYCSRHSIRANCEEDVSTWLQTLDFFISHEQPVQRDDTNANFNLDTISSWNAVPTEGTFQRNYVCGWVLKKCFQKLIKTCQICKENTTVSDASMESNSYIMAKEYYNDRLLLVYPSKDVVQCFFHIQNIVTNYVKTNIPRKCIKQDIKILTDIFATYPFTCEIHKEKLRNYFEEQVITVILCSWCRSINRILSGKITYKGDDPMKTRAQLYFNKRKHVKNKK